MDLTESFGGALTSASFPSCHNRLPCIPSSEFNMSYFLKNLMTVLTVTSFWALMIHSSSMNIPTFCEWLLISKHSHIPQGSDIVLERLVKTYIEYCINDVNPPHWWPSSLQFDSGVFTTSGVAKVMCCRVHPNNLAVMVIVVMLSPHTYFIIVSVLITYLYVSCEFQPEIIIVCLKWCIAVVKCQIAFNV